MKEFIQAANTHKLLEVTYLGFIGKLGTTASELSRGYFRGERDVVVDTLIKSEGLILNLLADDPSSLPQGLRSIYNHYLSYWDRHTASYGGLSIPERLTLNKEITASMNNIDYQKETLIQEFLLTYIGGFS